MPPLPALFTKMSTRSTDRDGIEYGGKTRDIEWERSGPPAIGADSFGDRVCPVDHDIVHQHKGALVGQCTCNSASHVLPGSGNESNPIA